MKKLNWVERRTFINTLFRTAAGVILLTVVLGGVIIPVGAITADFIASIGTNLGGPNG